MTGDLQRAHQDLQVRGAVIDDEDRRERRHGAVSDLHDLADSLTSGNEVDAALGRRISTLAANFDFDGINELAFVLDAANVQ